MGSPLICLPGLTRDSRDFTALADYFAGHENNPRAVFSIDARGRGQSEWSDDPSTYSLLQEADDVMAVTTALGLHDAILVGTSRGGMIAMVLAVQRAGLIKATILNDIAHSIPIKGLLRLKEQFSGADPMPQTWEQAAARLQDALGGQFPARSPNDWLAAARQTFHEEDGRPIPSYDPQITAGLAAISANSPSRDLTPQFRALCRKPVLLIRGRLSDLLTEQIAAEAEFIGSGSVEQLAVENEGHAPALTGRTLHAIDEFLKRRNL